MGVRPIDTGETVVQPDLFLGLAARLRAFPVLRRTVLAIGGNLAVILSKLEFDNAALRYVAAYEGTGRDGLLAGFLRYGWRVVGWAALSIALVGGGAAWIWRAHLPAGLAETILAAMVLMPLTALLAYSSSILQALRRVPQAQLPQVVL